MTVAIIVFVAFLDMEERWSECSRDTMKFPTLLTDILAALGYSDYNPVTNPQVLTELTQRMVREEIMAHQGYNLHVLTQHLGYELNELLRDGDSLAHMQSASADTPWVLQQLRVSAMSVINSSLASLCAPLAAQPVAAHTQRGDTSCTSSQVFTSLANAVADRCADSSRRTTHQGDTVLQSESTLCTGVAAQTGLSIIVKTRFAACNYYVQSFYDNACATALCELMDSCDSNQMTQLCSRICDHYQTSNALAQTLQLQRSLNCTTGSASSASSECPQSVMRLTSDTVATAASACLQLPSMQGLTSSFASQGQSTLCALASRVTLERSRNLMQLLADKMANSTLQLDAILHSTSITQEVSDYFETKLHDLLNPANNTFWGDANATLTVWQARIMHSLDSWVMSLSSYQHLEKTVHGGAVQAIRFAHNVTIASVALASVALFLSIADACLLSFSLEYKCAALAVPSDALSDSATSHKTVRHAMATHTARGRSCTWVLCACNGSGGQVAHWLVRQTRSLVILAAVITTALILGFKEMVVVQTTSYLGLYVHCLQDDDYRRTEIWPEMLCIASLVTTSTLVVVELTAHRMYGRALIVRAFQNKQTEVITGKNE